MPVLARFAHRFSTAQAHIPESFDEIFFYNILSRLLDPGGPMPQSLAATWPSRWPRQNLQASAPPRDENLWVKRAIHDGQTSS